MKSPRYAFADHSLPCNSMTVARKHAPIVATADDLGAALEVMQEIGEDHIAVVDNVASMMFVGCAHHRDVMNTYNRALAQKRHDGHNLLGREPFGMRKLGMAGYN